jgi:hypothetical protein
LFAAVLSVLLPATSFAQAIIAQSSGLANPQHVIDFGANLYPNFSQITTQFAGITVTHAAYFTTGVSNNLYGGFLTNYSAAGLPNTLTIVFASPIHDLSFVYHQVGTWQPSYYRAMLGGVTVDSFNNLSDQYQTNNYFGFTNVVFDELQIDFVGDFNLDTLAFNDAASAPQTYCTAGTTTHGCLASITASANPSVSLAHACTLAVANVEGQKSGILFYGINNAGFSPTPWGAGGASYLCVKAPLQRTPIQNSGGTVDQCDGSFTLDWNAYQTANPSALGNPWSVGAKVYAQGWFRDPPAVRATNLSNAVEMTYLP